MYKMKSVVLALSALLISAGAYAHSQHQGQQPPQGWNEGHMVNWFEIPVANMERAAKFYGEILAVEMKIEKNDEENYEMAVFPVKEGKVTGSLVRHEHMQPSDKGSVVYLNGGRDLSVVLNRLESAGGKIIIPKTKIPGVGYFANFMDTEGNRIGLFSTN
ncbi:MAG: VOC family protein [Bdellovibrionales bacterium]